jgi:hypothetical protein
MMEEIGGIRVIAKLVEPEKNEQELLYPFTETVPEHVPVVAAVTLGTEVVVVLGEKQNPSVFHDNIFPEPSFPRWAFLLSQIV